MWIPPRFARRRLEGSLALPLRELLISRPHKHAVADNSRYLICFEYPEKKTRLNDWKNDLFSIYCCLFDIQHHEI